MARFIYEVEVIYPDDDCQRVRECLQTVLHSGSEWGDGFEGRVLGGARQAESSACTPHVSTHGAPGPTSNDATETATSVRQGGSR